MRFFLSIYLFKLYLYLSSSWFLFPTRLAVASQPNQEERPGWWKFSQLSPGEGRAAGSGWNITLCFGWSIETFSSDTRLRTPDHSHHTDSHHCWPSAKVDLCHLCPGLTSLLCSTLIWSETTAIQGFKKIWETFHKVIDAALDFK